MAGWDASRRGAAAGGDDGFAVLDACDLDDRPHVPSVGLEQVASTRELLLDHEGVPGDDASGLFDDLAEGLRRSPTGEEVVDDECTTAGIERPSCDFDPVLDAFGRGENLTNEGVAITDGVVLLGVDDGDGHVARRRHRRRDPGCLGRHDEVGIEVREVFGDLPSDLVDDHRVDTMVEEVVDEDEVARNPSPLFHDCSDIHGRSVARRCRTDSEFRMVTVTVMPEPTVEQRRNARVILNRLKKQYPEISTALQYTEPWQLLVATVMSAQTTDANVNKVTPTLFERWPTPEDLAAARPEDVEEVIFSTGFYKQKTKSIIALSADLADAYDGVVPDDLAELVKLRGVGRKTASVVLAEAFGIPAIAVDTHVKRVAFRLGLTRNTDPTKIEFDLRALYPEKDWEAVSMRFIQFGRDTCHAKKPECGGCLLRDRCVYPDKTGG